MRVGNSYDLHNLIPGEFIYLGGVKIPCQYQVQAISDGDILLHTISEAIIGALGLGDLGEWFDETNVGLSSQVILTKALQLLKDQNYEIANVDSTIIVDRPKLQPHKKNIKDNLVKLLNVNSSQVNIKATTSEQNFPSIIQTYTTVLLIKK
ncbi:2-C-methyl-D-erythritol 2,4-cyclodiphosphate synthase [Spiroplasma sp. DGKH1]|uniref:2-C-methyl-D-erythritol 2,4-cyclodiphosphate synthase n=1 Tax=Spiroplasma sp. DGKH1 TaxID=3050074 RepID=UPI0034C5B92A